jgi:HK97 gp10 family phage protein
MNATYISNRSSVDAHVSAATARALEIIGGKAEGYAKAICPVDTGRLRNSITHQQYDETTEVIGTNVEYAPFVELGTHKMAERPYLRPAAENHAEEYKQIWNDELAKA